MTNEQRIQGLKIMTAIVTAIREAGSIPAGTIYATMMSFVTLGAFESLVDQIVGTGLVKKDNHLLIWVG